MASVERVRYRLNVGFPDIPWRREFVRVLFIVGAALTDIVLIGIAGLIADIANSREQKVGAAFDVGVALMIPYMLACLATGAFSPVVLASKSRSSGKALTSICTAAAVVIAAAFAFGVTEQLSRREFISTFVISAVCLIIGRCTGGELLRALRGLYEPRVMTIGESTDKHLAGSEPFLDVSKSGWVPNTNDPRFLYEIHGALGDAERVLLLFQDHALRKRWAGVMRIAAVDAEIVDFDLSEVTAIGVGTWRGGPTLVVSRGALTLWERFVKRTLDLTLTILLTPAVVPIVAMCALAVRIESKGPAFFIQERLGKNHVPYCCYKLRTMRVEAQDKDGTRSAERHDTRVTVVGRFLRSTSLDELPQFWNVLCGDMSLVGPRPHAFGSTAEGELFWDALEGYCGRHSVRPGLTGLAQVRGFRGATTSRQQLVQRVAADIEYINSWSIYLDLKILLRTVFVLIHRNAF